LRQDFTSYPFVIMLTVELPEQIASRFANTQEELGRCVLEGLALLGFNQGILTVFEVGQMLGFESRWETDDFLKSHHTRPDHDAGEIEREVLAAESLLAS
jgi:hypothetical protein